MSGPTGTGMTQKLTYNRTKIIATVGPACESPAILQELILAGVDIFRLNLSHGDWEKHRYFIREIRRLNLSLRTRVGILADLQGPKMRIGKMTEALPVRPGDRVIFSTQVKDLQPPYVPVEYETLAKDVQPGDTVLVEDGRVQLRVLRTDGVGEVELEVVAGDRIASRKGINLPGRPISLPTLSEKDWADLHEIVQEALDWVALSFVRKVEDILDVKAFLRRFGASIRVMAKIERPEALENIEAIIAASDGVMIARGDLGVEIPIEEVPFWQKNIIETCARIGKPAVVATQMLESMIQNSTPTRAEVGDVANAVLDGADAVMLSGETSMGAFPVKAVEYMQRILRKAEQDPRIYERSGRPAPDSPTFESDAVCWTACALASALPAKVLVGLTYSGYTAYELARWRPATDIFIFTSNPRILNSLGLLWGVRTFYYRNYDGTYETIQDVLHILRDLGYVEKGDRVVFAVSMPLRARRRTNTLHITTVE
jgi:pyruvate kinase